MTFACSTPARESRLNFVVPCIGAGRPADFYGVFEERTARTVAVAYGGFGFWRVKRK